MGKKGGWCCAVARDLSPEPKAKESADKENNKSKKKWFRSYSSTDVISSSAETAVILTPPAREEKLNEAENEQNKHAYSVAIATAVAAEAAVAAAQAAAEVVRITSTPHLTGKSKEEIAAIKIQTVFRGYMARRALQALRGLVRLKLLIDGPSVKRQAANTLRCMQTLARVQSQVRARRIRMSEENQSLQRMILQKREKEIENIKAYMGEEWDDSTQSQEKKQANLLNRQEAALRRERALAYAFSHQQMWKNSSKSANPTFMDPHNPHWGWSWLERWMSARPWESRSATEKELNSDHASIKSMTSRAMSVGEITRAYARRDLNNVENLASPTAQRISRPSSRQSPSTPPSKVPSFSSGTGRGKQVTRSGGWGTDEDSKSMLSAQSERCRRHSLTGSSARDDESLTSSAAFPGYMAPTESAKAKSRFSSPSPMVLSENNGTPEKGSLGSSSAKKKLTFSPASVSGPRRNSGHSMVDTFSPIKDITENTGNGGSR